MRRSYGASVIAAALSLLGFQAMAIAPVIDDLPSPVIGNEGIASPPNAFVYEDAFSLDTYVSDDTTSDGAIVWSYDGAGNRYSINGVARLGAGNQNNPASARIDVQDLDPGTTTTDGNPRTVTLRDVLLSPIGGPNTDPGTTGVLFSEVLTLFASDGTTWSQGEMIVYTDNGGDDRLSPGSVQEYDQDFSVTAPTTDWVSANFGTATATKAAVDGLCVSVGVTGANLGYWVSPYGAIQLTANKVYRVRASVESNNATVNRTPLWDLVLENIDTQAFTVDDIKYFVDMLVLDNLGGANSAHPSVGRAGTNNFEVWFTPMPVTAADWNDGTNGIFQASLDARNDADLMFRVLEADNTGYGGELDSGRICIHDISVDSFDISSLGVSSTEYDVDTITNGTSGGTTSVINLVTNSTTATFGGGNVTVSPNTGGPLASNAWDVEFITIWPGNTTYNVLTTPAETPDNFPIIDAADGLYKSTMGVTAPNATAVTNPPDAIFMITDDASVEILQTGAVTAARNNIGMPKQSVVSDYTQFYFSHSVCAATSPINLDRIRSYAAIGCNTAFSLNGQLDNLGGTTFTYFKVEKVNYPN